MEYENSGFPQEEQVIAVSEAEAPSAPETEVKPSPYADSPYEINITPPAEAPKPKKKSNVGKRILCAVMILALIAASSLVTGIVLNGVWQKRSDAMAKSFNEKWMCSNPSWTVPRHL